MMQKSLVAVLGTGLMGGPMARNLLKAGFRVNAWNRTAEKARVLEPLGASVFASPQEAVRGADFAITMLSDGPAVHDVLFEVGVADAMRAGSTVIDMSSIKPEEAQAHHGRLLAMGIRHLDAPVSGGTRAAEAGNLAIMAGGEAETFEAALPVLEAMGRPVLVGPTGLGQLSKLANQAIVASTIAVVAEAMLLVKKGGGDPVRLRDALKGGFADSVILQQHGERMTSNNFAPGGRSSVQLKDMNNIMGAAQALRLELPLSAMQQQRFARLCNELGGADLDHSALYLELLDRNGLKAGE
ncbi:MAG: NAD(P)-dependent oxidoreductase [Rhizobiaceae bacterium]